MTATARHGRGAGLRRLIVAIAIVCVGCAERAGDSEPPRFEPGRLLQDIETYYDFGIHRTAHPGDERTSAWLADRLAAAGLEISEQVFVIRQFFLEEASIEDSTGRMQAFPVWLPHATPAEGVTGRLVALDGTIPAEQIRGSIAWVRSGGDGDWTRLQEMAAAAGARAIVIETDDGMGRGNLRAVNAERTYVQASRPVPTLLHGAADTPRLERSLGHDVTVRIVGRMVEQAEARNVYARKVVDEDADWMIVSTPSSGWFECAGERGPGIAMLLALAEWVGQRTNGLNYMFVATSGHELDFLGARLFHEARLAPPPERTRAWLHLGAQIATPPWEEVGGVLAPTDRVTTGTLQATDRFASAMVEAFASLPAFVLRTGTRIGEFRDLVEHGYEGLGLVGGSNPWFHVPGDDPRGVSVETLSEVTTATARALLAIEEAPPRDAAALAARLTIRADPISDRMLQRLNAHDPRVVH